MSETEVLGAGISDEGKPKFSRENKKWKRRTRPGNKGIRKFLGMDHMRLDDMSSIPPLQLDEDDTPIRPVRRLAKHGKSFSEAERKVRFLRMVNYSAGNIHICCYEAGITRQYYNRHWAKDPEFQAAFKLQMEDVYDRALYKFHQRIGVIPSNSQEGIHDPGLMAFIKAHKPDTFVGEVKEEDAPQGQSNIPRATRPA